MILIECNHQELAGTRFSEEPALRPSIRSCFQSLPAMSDLGDRLYDHFQRERAVFGRWMFILVSLSAFHLFVFEPYITATHQLMSAQQRLSSLGEQIDLAQQEIENATSGIERASDIIGDASEIQSVYDDAKNWVQDIEGIHRKYDLQSRRVTMLRDSLPPELRNRWQPNNQSSAVIAALREARPEAMQNYRDDPCFFKIELNWLKCQVSRKLEPINKQVSHLLYDRTMSHAYTKELQDAIQLGRNQYSEGFEDAVAREELVPWVREYLEKERKIIRQWYESMAGERRRLAREADKQREVLARLVEERESLELSRQELAQMGRPQTPFGPLPLTFQGVVVLLPLFLLVTVILLVRSQHRLQIFRAHYQKNAPEEDADNPVLELVMPLLPAPDGNTLKAIGVLMGYTLPVLLALMGVYRLRSVPELATYGDQITLVGNIPTAVILVLVFLYYIGIVTLAWRGASAKSTD